jgi:hypothetical protein
MMNKHYAPIARLSRNEILKALSHGDSSAIHNALLSAAYWDSDWKWAQQRLVDFADSSDEHILWAVALGFGFIAVFHGEIDEEIVWPILIRLKNWPVTWGRPSLAAAAEETEEEIDHFVRRRRMGEKISLGRRLPEDWRPPGER